MKGSKITFLYGVKGISSSFDEDVDDVNKEEGRKKSHQIDIVRVNEKGSSLLAGLSVITLCFSCSSSRTRKWS